MSDRPEKVTGGCLCGSIRYDITFPEDASWPADVRTLAVRSDMGLND